MSPQSNKLIFSNELYELLDKSPSVGFRMLIERCRGYGLDDLRFEAILLSGKYNLADSPEKVKLIEEAKSLGKKVDEWTKEHQDINVKLGITDFSSSKSRLSSLPIFEDISSPSPVVFSCDNVKKAYKKSDFTLSDISLDLKEGEITGIVGENGNGKSTLLKIIAGELLTDEGTISYGELDDTKGVKNWPLIKSRISFLEQDLPIIRGNIRKSLQFGASLRGLKGRRNTEEVNYIINRLGLKGLEDAVWKNLSGGYRLRFALAKVLVSKPRLLVLDEPLANLDINTQMLVLNDLRNMTDITGNRMSVVISSQNLEEVEAVADKMLVIKKGRIEFYGRSSDIGIERTANTFEIKSPIEKGELQMKLSGINYTSMYDNGFFFIINAPIETDKFSFLKYCSDQNIVLDYFNDISSSVKKFIIQNK